MAGNAERECVSNVGDAHSSPFPRNRRDFQSNRGRGKRAEVRGEIPPHPNPFPLQTVISWEFTVTAGARESDSAIHRRLEIRHRACQWNLSRGVT